MLLRPVRRIAAALSANRNSSARPTTEFRASRVAPRPAVEVVIESRASEPARKGSSLSLPRGARAHSQGAGMAEEGDYVADFEAVDDSVLLAAIKQRGAKVEPLCK